MPHLSDGGQRGVFIGDIDAGGVVEDDDLGGATSLLALSVADRSTGVQQIGRVRRRVGTWRCGWPEGGNVEMEWVIENSGIPLFKRSTILARGFYDRSDEREINHRKLEKESLVKR